MYKNPPSKETQMCIFNTSTLKSFNELNYDKLLYPSNIKSSETYIKLTNDKDADMLNGFTLTKHHHNSPTETTYFLRAEDIHKLPIMIINTKKINYNKEVYNLIIEFEKVKIEPQKKMTFKELVDYTGQPHHTNITHFTLYKIKCLYARTKSQVYFRTISNSAFGKTKYLESLNLLLNKCCIISDASSPKLFFAVCYQKLICLNEMPDTSDKKQWIKFTNMVMNIGDKSKSIENPSRKKEGTFDVADTSKLSVCFTHNFSEYYKDVGLKSFEEIFPNNVINRYYYNLYEGQVQFKQKYNFNAEQEAINNQEFIKDVIRTSLWYEENWDKIENPYSESILDGFKFPYNYPRFKEHFQDISKAIAEYSEGDINVYMKLLVEEYKSYKKHYDLLNSNSQSLNSIEQNMFNLVKK